MPNLTKLAQVGTNFTRCFSIGGNTTLSMPGIFCSQKLYDKEKNLPHLLSKHSYTTGMIQSCPIHADFRYGFKINKTTYDDVLKQKTRRFLDRHGLLSTLRKFMRRSANTKKRLGLPYRRSSHLLMETEKAITSYASPWFHWVQLMDAHIPYMPIHNDLDRNEMRDLNDKILDSIHRGYEITKTEQNQLKSLYKDEIKYMDSRVSAFLKWMMINHPKTLMIVTSDHGEEFGEYGWYSHSPGAHGPTPQLLHVPLIFFGLGIKAGTIFEYVSHLDLAPTILDYAGINEKLGYGKSLRRFLG